MPALAAGLLLLTFRSFAASLVIASAPAFSLGTAGHSVALAVSPAHAAALRQIAQAQAGSLPGDPASYRSALLTLEDVRLSAAGADGGYFYNVYLAAPGATPSEQQLAGTLGPFEIAGARQRGTASLRYGLAVPLAALRTQALSSLAVSFRHAGGAGTATDQPLINIGRLRLELSTEAGN